MSFSWVYTITMNHFESGDTPRDTTEGMESDLFIEKLKPDLRMQVDLALRFYGISKDGLSREDLNSYIVKWIQYDNSRFSADFRRALTEHPELLAEYQRDPESALTTMENVLYERAHDHRG